MRIKLIARNELKNRFLKDLSSGNMEISDKEYELVVSEPHQHKNSIIGKYGNDYYIIPLEDIIYFHADDTEVFCTTKDKVFFVKEKLHEIESLFFEQEFIRISKSYIISKKYIHSIKPSLNMKYIVVLKDGQKVYVTRTYYYHFKDFIGF